MVNGLPARGYTRDGVIPNKNSIIFVGNIVTERENKVMVKTCIMKTIKKGAKKTAKGIRCLFNL